MPMGQSRVFASVLLLLLSLSAAGQSTSSAINPVLHALCGKQVAMLGESPVHGFGATLEFKAAVVRRLVDGCHYNAFFIESGTYDFIRIDRTLKSGQDVTDDMVTAAIGGIWHNREMQSLVPFLTERANVGRLMLGGLDDQLGAGTWASRGMADDLARDLNGDEKSRCLGILQRRLSWQYSDQAPYSPAEKAKVLGCLDEIEDGRSGAEKGREPSSSTYGDKAMTDSLRRFLARDFTEDDPTKKYQEVRWYNDRDRSMYLNFKWLFSQLPRHSKVIVWTATVHLAKDLSTVKGFEGRVPFGSSVERDFEDRAFALGFSAYSGEYAFVHQPIRQLDPAPASSLEGQAFAHGDSEMVYLSRKQLGKYGSLAARPLGINFETTDWDRILDGLVIIRKEHAPGWISH